MMIFTPNEQRQQKRIHALERELTFWRYLGVFLLVLVLALLIGKLVLG